MAVITSRGVAGRGSDALASRRQIDDTAEWLVRYGCYALFLLLPIAYAPFLDDPYTLPKVTLLRFLTLAILLASALRVLGRGRLQWHWQPLDRPVLAFAGVSIGSTVFSISPALSLGGEFHRYDGLYTVLNYVVLYFVASRTLVTTKSIHHALQWLGAGGITVALLGLPELFAPAGPGAFAGRIAGSFGNPDFLGSYLVMAVPIIGVLAMAGKRRALRLFWMLGTVLATLVLVLTYTRGAWLGFAVALAVLVIGGRRSIGRAARPLLVALALALALALAISELAPRLDGNSAERSLVSRLASTVDLQSGTVANRLLIWRSTLPLVAERPLLGSGLTTFALVFPGVAPPEYARTEGRDYITDQAHNGYLQLAITSGLLGLGAYLWLLVSCGRSFWRTLAGAKGGSRWLVLGVFAAWAGYLAQDFFLFGMVGSTAIWWLLNGVAMALAAKYGDRHSHAIRLEAPRAVRWTLRIVLALGAACLGFFAVRPAVADYYMARATALPMGGHLAGQQVDTVLHWQREALAWMPAESGYLMAYTATLSNLPESRLATPAGQAILRDGIARLDQAIAIDSLRPWLHFDRGVLYWQLGEAGLPKAFANMKEATRLYPNFFYANVALAEISHALGRSQEAISAERRLLLIDPSDRWVQFNLAADLAAGGEQSEALALLNRALEQGDDASLIVLQGTIYEQLGRRDDATVAYRRALAVAPQDGEARARLNILTSEEDGRGDGR